MAKSVAAAASDQQFTRLPPCSEVEAKDIIIRHVENKLRILRSECQELQKILEDARSQLQTAIQQNRELQQTNRSHQSSIKIQATLVASMASQNQQLSLEAGQLKFELKLLKDRFQMIQPLFSMLNIQLASHGPSNSFADCYSKESLTKLVSLVRKLISTRTPEQPRDKFDRIEGSVFRTFEPVQRYQRSQRKLILPELAASLLARRLSPYLQY